MIPVFIPRLGTRHYAVRVGRSFTVPREARDTHALERVMAEVVGEFEAVVRRFPTQWFQFSPFWPGDAVRRHQERAARLRTAATTLPSASMAPRPGRSKSQLDPRQLLRNPVAHQIT